MKVALLTISDTCSSDPGQDKTSPKLAEMVREQENMEIKHQIIIADEKEDILVAIKTVSLDCSLIITTGGTGFGARDVTPEAVRTIIEKEASGLTIAMMMASLKITPLAALSRPVCGVYKKSLIITLPGSTKGACENLQAIIKVLPHALELIVDKANDGEMKAGDNFHKALRGGHDRHSCVYHSDHSKHSKANLMSNDPSLPLTLRARISPFPLVSFQEALQLVLKNSLPLKVVNFSIYDSITGYVIAQSIVSPEAVPAYRASVVDGYAVVHSDGPGLFPVLDTSIAGKSLVPDLVSGSVVRVTTGAPVPNGATAVVMVEDTTVGKVSEKGLKELSVHIHASCQEGQFIRPIGSDIALHETILESGTTITASGGEIGVLSSVGITNIDVYKKPIVAILSTGNELYEPSFNGQLPKGAIRDCNRVALKQVAEYHGFKVVDLGIASDDVTRLTETIANGLDKSDVLITTGGVSMGEMDFLKPVLERNLNATIHFGRVALKPGKPTTFATIPPSDRFLSPKLVFALPGNPVSALVTFHLFVLPCLKKSSGMSDPFARSIKVKLGHEISLDRRPEYCRATLSGQESGYWVAHQCGHQQSSRVKSMKGAHVLLVLPASTLAIDKLSAGTLVDGILF